MIVRRFVIPNYTYKPRSTNDARYALKLVARTSGGNLIDQRPDDKTRRFAPKLGDMSELTG